MKAEAMDNNSPPLLRFEHVKAVVDSGANVAGGLSQLIDYCQAKRPHHTWDRIRDIEVQSDINYLRGWLKSVFLSEPPPESIKAFYFGIFNPVRADDTESCDMYISGSTRFDPKDEDWACWYHDSYLPNGRYAGSRVLHELYSVLAEEASVKEVGEYVLCLGYACLAVKEIFADSPLPVAVGFDSGDLILVKS